MVWKCPPLNLPNWNNFWKWKQEMNNKERSLAEEITEGFDALKRIRELESDNAELKAYNTTLHGIEHDLEMKVSKLQAEIEALKDEVAEWKMSYENCHRMCSGYGMN